MNFAEFLRRDIENFLKYYAKHERSERLNRLKSMSEISVLEKVQYSQLKSALNKSDKVSLEKALESLKSTFKNSNEDIKHRILKVLEENLSQGSSGSNQVNSEIISALNELKSQMNDLMNSKNNSGTFFSNATNPDSNVSSLNPSSHVGFNNNSNGFVSSVQNSNSGQVVPQVIKYVPVSSDVALGNSVFSTSKSNGSDDDVSSIDDCKGMKIPFKKGTGKVVLLPGNITMDHGIINFTEPSSSVEVFENGVVKPYGKVDKPSVYELELKAELVPLHTDLVRKINSAIIREDLIGAKSLINDLILLYKKFPSKFKKERELILSDIALFKERVDKMDAKIDADFIKHSVLHRNIGSGHSVVYSSNDLNPNLRVNSDVGSLDLDKKIGLNLGDAVDAIDSMLDNFEVSESKTDGDLKSKVSGVNFDSIDSNLFSYSKFLKSSTLSGNDIKLLNDLLLDFKVLKQLIVNKDISGAESKFDELSLKVSNLYGSKFIEYRKKLLLVLKSFLKVISFLKEKSLRDSVEFDDFGSFKKSVVETSSNSLSKGTVFNKSLDPNSVQNLYLRGVNLFYESDYRGAKAIFEKVLELNKSNRAALIRLNQCNEKLRGELNE